jgi:hypothetical protein
MNEPSRVPDFNKVIASSQGATFRQLDKSFRKNTERRQKIFDELIRRTQQETVRQAGRESP